MVCYVLFVLGGGIWRVKWNLSNTARYSDMIAVACMHGGSGIYRYDHGAGSPPHLAKIASYVDANESRLVYGIDWLYHSQVAHTMNENACSTESADILLEVVTCSFYDNLVQTWSCKI